MSFWFRIVPIAATLAVSAVSGTYYTVRLAHECAGVGFVSCIKDTLFSAPSVLPVPPKRLKKDQKSGTGKTTPGAIVSPQAAPQQEVAIEAMLISTGHLDGEVGRIAKSDFDKAVRAFQAELGRDGVGGELSATQRKVLQSRSEGVRAAWQIRSVSEGQGFELSLPARLLPESQILQFGRRYQMDSGDFSVDVAQFLASEWTLKKLEGRHCCGPTRKLERTPILREDGDISGFILSALDGTKRISVRAFQKDNVIRLLSITYNVERDSEYRSLRNAIASSYVPFASAAKPARVASCASEDSGREACNDKSDGWWRNIFEPK